MAIRHSDPTAQKVPDAPPNAVSSRLRLALWIGGAFVAVAVALAAVSFVGGDGLAALKWLVLAFFGPMVAYCAGFAVWFVRHPGWYRRPPDIAWVAGLSGVVLLFVPILAYLPWAANRL